MKAAKLFVHCLENEGIEYIFGIPGEENLDLMDALLDSSIKFITVRHEQGAAFMADVYGRLTGKAGVCLATLGPGATNLITGVADANMDHAPLVAIAGQAGTYRLHKESHQVLDLEQMFAAVTKYSSRLVACFASCVDFVHENAWPAGPTLAQAEAWFTSEEQMWWGTWPAHVQGWWDLASRHPNVLFVHFEEMKRDLAGVTRQVAAFLGMAPLTDEEVAAIVHKCGFRYMQEHQEAFEMHPPHIYASDAELFKKGSADRQLDVPEDARRRVAAWCATAMRGGAYPLRQHYPDVAEADAAV